MNLFFISKEISDFSFISNFIIFQMIIFWDIGGDFYIFNKKGKRKSKIFLNDIKVTSILKKFIEFEELFFLDGMLKECSKTHLQNLNNPINRNAQQRSYEYDFALLDKNIICFFILSGYSVLEFIYNLSYTIKAFSILLLTDLFIRFHSTHGWKLVIGFIYKDFGFTQNDQITYCLVSTFLVILDTILKYLISVI
ncbi:Chloroplast envelope membrane protein [Glycine max]|nr:Chloroplast envelope membrane protein [Glycine max]